MEYIKKADADPRPEDDRIRHAVAGMLADIEVRGEAAVTDYARKFDGWEGDFVLSDVKRQRLIDSVPPRVKDDIGFAHG